MYRPLFLLFCRLTYDVTPAELISLEMIPSMMDDEQIYSKIILAGVQCVSLPPFSVPS